MCLCVWGWPYLSVDERGEVEVVEHVHAVLPGVGVPVLAHALLVEPVHLGDFIGSLISLVVGLVYSLVSLVVG